MLSLINVFSKYLILFVNELYVPHISSECSFCVCLHVQEESPRLWGHLLAVYWVSLVSYYLLWKAYKHVSGLRADALMTPELKPEQFAILVRDVPPVLKGQTKKEHVDSYFKNIYPETFYRSMVVTDNKEVRH
jgi:hypothetical protein